jgi:hypothetical protein
VRNSILRAYGLGIITGGFITAAVISFAPPAKADAAYSYAAHYGAAVCQTIDETVGQYSNDDIFLGIGQAVIEDGFSAYQAGQILYWSIEQYCPQHMDRVLSFAADVEMVA